MRYSVILATVSSSSSTQFRLPLFRMSLKVQHTNLGRSVILESHLFVDKWSISLCGIMPQSIRMKLEVML
jgi:hypothetical protein